MRRAFGAQTSEEIARKKWVSDDADWHTSIMWYKRTGRPPKNYEDYPYLTLIALIAETDKLIEEEREENSGKAVFKQTRRIGPPNSGGTKWGKAQRTGDPQIDQWEQEIAAGLIPDLEK